MEKWWPLSCAQKVTCEAMKTENVTSYLHVGMMKLIHMKIKRTGICNKCFLQT